MSASELVTRMFDALIEGDDATFFSLVTDDFEFSGPLPVPVSAEGWFAITRLVALAFPDIRYHFRVIEAQGDRVQISTQLTGTHTGMLDLSPVGKGVHPATGKSFSNPVEEGLALVVEGRVVSVQVTPAEGGGIPGLLAQLGIDMG